MGLRFQWTTLTTWSPACTDVNAQGYPWVLERSCLWQWHILDLLVAVPSWRPPSASGLAGVYNLPPASTLPPEQWVLAYLCSAEILKWKKPRDSTLQKPCKPSKWRTSAEVNASAEVRTAWGVRLWNTGACLDFLYSSSPHPHIPKKTPKLQRTTQRSRQLQLYSSLTGL